VRGQSGDWLFYLDEVLKFSASGLTTVRKEKNKMDKTKSA
jgi:hypothetical protein